MSITVKNRQKTQSLETGIRIVEVRIRNFRSLRAVNVHLGRTTILIGENNSGKTSFLEAIHAAIGGVRRGLTVDDIFTTAEESVPPKDRAIIVDLHILPTDDTGTPVDVFPAGEYWTSLFGNGIKQGSNDNDFVAIRTILQWNEVDAEYRVERRFLKEWPKSPDKMESASVDSSMRVSPTQIEPISLFFIDAKRDIEDDMRRQRSIWGRLTSDLGLTDKLAKEIEKALSDLNATMIEKSEVLTHLRENLQVLNSLVAGEDEGVKISPVARTIRDLTKGIGLDFTTKGSQTFPLARHGMGTKSLAAILVFRAFVSWRIKRAQDDKIHPTLALEEPEAHLHPQAQRALISQISEIPGQVIVSTHSPYVAAQIPIENLRHFAKNSAESLVSEIDTSDLEDSEIEKIDRMVMNTRGEILFSRAIVLFEGAAEENALPIFATAWWGKNAHMCGLSFVGVGGDRNYLPFLRMAEMCYIPWFVFADGEAAAVESLKKQMKKIGVPSVLDAPNIVILPDGNNFERYIVEQDYEDAICAMLDSYWSTDDFISIYIDKKDGQKAKHGVTRDYKSDGGRNRALFDALMARKVGYAKQLATEIVTLESKKRRFPPMIKNLLTTMSIGLGLSPAEESIE